MTPEDEDGREVFLEGCPDCGRDTVEDDDDRGVVCRFCGWRD